TWGSFRRQAGGSNGGADDLAYIIRPNGSIDSPFYAKMGQKNRTIILSETDTLFSLKLKSNETRRGWCQECAAEVIWLEPRTAKDLFGTTNLLENPVVHLSDAGVCWRSLLKIRNEEGLRGERP